MRLLLARIDDRFIHGQVTVGWGQRLKPDVILLASDEIAGDPWQARVYASAVPPGMEVMVLDLAQAAAALRDSAAACGGRARAILLTGSCTDMQTLISLGAPIDRINVGGMHFAAGKQQLLPSIYVDSNDLAIFRAFLTHGVAVAAQAVPGGREFAIDEDLLAAMEARL